MKGKKVSLRIKDEDYSKLKKLAGEEESLSAYIRMVLKKHIKNYRSDKKSFLERFRIK